MNKGLYFLTFAAGVGAGILGTWRHFKKKYDLMAEKNRELYEAWRKEEPAAEPEPEKEETPEEAVKKIQQEKADRTEDIKEYVEMLNKVSYGKSSNGKKVHRGPYVIPPEDYDEFEDYDAIELVLYKDGVLADRELNIVKDATIKLGDFYNHFGEYEEDSVFVRNDIFHADYEILRDEQTYREALNSRN